MSSLEHSEPESTDTTNGAPAKPRKRRGRPSAAPVSVVLQEVREARAHCFARLNEIAVQRQALDAEHDEIQEALGIHSPDSTSPKPLAKASAKRAVRKVQKPTAERKPRGPRADSLPSRILAHLAEHDRQTSIAIVGALGVTPKDFHGAMQSLLKAGKVTSTGERKDRTWSKA